MGDARDSDDGSNPADDIKRQNPDGTTNDDQASNANDNHPGESNDDPRKVEELAKAGRENFDTDAEQH